MINIQVRNYENFQLGRVLVLRSARFRIKKEEEENDFNKLETIFL